MRWPSPGIPVLFVVDADGTVVAQLSSDEIDRELNPLLVRLLNQRDPADL